jgi:predicted nucleic acid-binding Zn ribbon protein
VYCPRCGTPAEPDSRFCISCGAALARVAGSTRRARALTVGTVVAVALAIAAFVALPTPAGNTPPYDAYARAADRQCVQSKHEIVAAEPQQPKGNLPGFARYADQIVTIAANWRSSLTASPPPPDRRDLVSGLDSALQTVEIEAGGLARAARQGDTAAVVARAKRLDASTTQVENSIVALGLIRCSHFTVAFGGLVRQP